MPNLSELEAAIPVAPLKLVVLDSASKLGNSVNSHLVNFRRDVKNIAKNDPAFEGYVSDNYVQLDYCLGKTGVNGCKNRIGNSYKNFVQNDELKKIGNTPKSIILLQNSNTSSKDYIINADKQKIEQVIYNLISNAINYTGEDKKITIELVNNKKEF